MSPWKCLFGHRKPICVGVNHKSIQWVQKGVEPRPGGWISTTVATMRCETCGDVWANELKESGHLSVAQINGD